VKFLFEGVNETNGPFDNATRIFLVDSILKNLSFSSESELSRLKIANGVRNLKENLLYNSVENQISTRNLDGETQTVKIDYNKGLEFMLIKQYFKDAFPLHDHSSKMRTAYFSNEVFDLLKMYAPEDEASTDQILSLHNKWAKLSKIFCFQPLNLIRNYFGESYAFYFAWFGTFINSLILPAFIGIVFFAIGQIMSIQNSNSLSTLSIAPIQKKYLQLLFFIF